MGLFSWARRRPSAIRSVKPVAEAAAPVALLDPVDRAAAAADAAQRGVVRLGASDFSGARDAFCEALSLEPDSAAYHVNLAYALQQSGQTDEALPHLREAVALDSRSFDARYMLGAALEEAADLPGAAAQLQAAVALRPEFEPAHADLCRVLALSGDTVAARRAIGVAIARNPANPDFHHALGNLCMTEGQPERALPSYEAALALRPESPEMRANHGLALHALERYDEAVACFERAIALRPSSSEAYAHLGLTRKAQRRFAEAAVALERSLELNPDQPEYYNDLGTVYSEQGEVERAIAAYRRAIALRPDLPGGYGNLGLALFEQGDATQAVATYRQGLAIKPIAAIHDNLGIALQKLGAVDEAIEHYRRAIELQPENLNTHCNLAAALADGGGPREAIAAYRKILELRPAHLVAHSNLLFNLSVDEHCTPQQYLAEAARYDCKVAAPADVRSLPRRPRQGRRLRVGLVSGDLRVHPVGYFLEGILHELDQSRFELFAYSTVRKGDALTARIQALFAGWRVLKGVTNDDAARLIRDDGIDILLDLSGHTGDNRLPVFGLRPAPIQVSWLGYFASTGVSAMDWVLADEACVPIGNEYQFTEKIWRLPDTRLCFTPPLPGIAPDVGPLPALRNGFVTFGCFQRLPKISDAVLDAWRGVFASLPDARLLLQGHQTGRPLYVEQIRSRLAAVGIAADRVTVRGPAPRAEYLESYGDVDMVLDTFPYTGGTTTCEALWMGVPTITLAGDSMIARQGAALMQAADLGDWVAASRNEYVAKSVAAASDLDALAELRASLRERLPATSLFDVSRFAKNLGDALDGIWAAGDSRRSQ